MQVVRPVVSERSLLQGEALFQQGNTCYGIFRLNVGRVRLLRQTSAGDPVVIHVAMPGETFAEASLFSDTYHCAAVADIPSRVSIIPKDAILRAFRADPAAGMAFMARLAHRLQAVRSRLEIRNIRSADERTYQYLRLQVPSGKRELALDRPLKDMAAEIGLTHEAFYRALSSLAIAGAIVRHGKTIKFCEEEKRDLLKSPTHR